MSSVPFYKYTSFGNNFVLVDEIEHRVFSEEQKMRFAYYATSRHFGIGADNFLVLQRYDEKTLRQINDYNQYWNKLPDSLDALFIFRMFEPDGSEALSCGNGLMCMAKHLFRKYGVSQARLMTEAPTKNPKTVTIGSEFLTETFYVNLGNPRRMPSELSASSIRKPLDSCIDCVDELKIDNFRQSDIARFFGVPQSLDIKGYLVFTGEPHLVIFADEGLSLKKPAGFLFPQSADGGAGEKRVETGMDLVKFIGNYITQHYCDCFPRGININFLCTTSDKNTLEYRCFERGINQETLACGTGALACAYVAHQLGLVSSKEIKLRPYLCRLYNECAEIKVKKMSDGWQISGNPQFLFSGNFMMLESGKSELDLEFLSEKKVPDHRDRSLSFS